LAQPSPSPEGDTPANYRRHKGPVSPANYRRDFGV
jgi:hypothetical protein